MTTTIVKNSVVGDAWLQQTAAACPIQRIIDPATGQDRGDILTGPVRLSFPNLFKLPEKRQGQTSEPKYGTSILFTPLADFKLLYEDYYKIAYQVFPEYYNAQAGQFYGLESPFRDQIVKANKYEGYTPGSIFMTCTSKYKPPVVDINHNPIVDEAAIYPGVWAICAIRAYDYGKNPPQPKKGVAFGLQSVMIIGNDKNIGGGGVDTRKQFHGVNVAAPIVRPDMLHNMPTGGAPGQPAGIPGYTMPGAPTGPAPQIPQQHYAVPGGAAAPSFPPGFTPPGTAPIVSGQPPVPGQPSAPIVTTYPINPGGPVSEDEDTSYI